MPTPGGSMHEIVTYCDELSLMMRDGLKVCQLAGESTLVVIGHRA